MNINQKRQQFTKDLDKLISGDYVLAPKEPTPLMEQKGMECGGGILTKKIYQEMLAVAQQQIEGKTA
ncbi:hypothetical protein [Acinetobacter piscicola]|uniref:hypothetical protein n=1 Tax=Acinetobacter piscicola TaxID=2006115 RepID=UPI001021573E|nr:hypothetical protein [Acinetobacter piscicola]RYL25165.1 hypothetical protein EWP19_13430 [Acinetobacter piscicola]